MLPLRGSTESSKLCLDLRIFLVRYGMYYHRSSEARSNAKRYRPCLQGEHVTHHIAGAWNGMWTDIMYGDRTHFMRYGLGLGLLVSASSCVQLISPAISQGAAILEKNQCFLQCQNDMEPENIDIDTNIKCMPPLFAEIWDIANLYRPF